MKESSLGRDPECNLWILQRRRIRLVPIGQYSYPLSWGHDAAFRGRAIAGNVQGGSSGTGFVPLHLGS
jgi:hypothetical protein